MSDDQQQAQDPQPDSTRKRYSGQAIDVTFDPPVCQHAAECIRGLPSVFDTKARPWINPDGATAAEIEAQVARCPSGALQVAPPTGA